MKQLLALSQDNHILESNDAGHFKLATVMDDLGWIAIGRYPVDSKMGGCDTLPSVDIVKAALLIAHVYRPDYWIVFEGMMISTIKSTFFDYLLYMQRDYAIEPLFVILDTNPEACIERIARRGTMKPGLKYENIASKCANVVKHAKTYDQSLVRYIYPDHVQTEDMLETFLDVVGDTALLEQL